MRTLLLFCTLVLFSGLNAQTDTPALAAASVATVAANHPETITTKKKTKKRAFKRAASVRATFRGGAQSWSRYLAKHLQYTDLAREYGVEGEVLVRFRVEADGTISNVRVVESLFAPIDRLVVETLNTMPNWRPARQGTRHVPMNVTVPISFSLR